MGHDDRTLEGSEPRALLAGYEALREKFTTMLNHAKDGDWDAVIQQESAYLAELEHLRFLEAQMELDSASAQRKTALMREILEQSAEIQRHLVARRDHLGELIRDAGDRREATGTYQSVESLSLNPENI